jgi:hypothetical protein
MQLKKESWVQKYLNEISSLTNMQQTIDIKIEE